MRLNAAVGFAVWLGVVALALAGRFWVLEPALLLPPLVLVPLALGLIGEGLRGAWVRAGHAVAAAAATASFFTPRGPRAAALALAWVAFTGAVALVALARLWRRRFRGISELAIDAGLMFLPVGSTWMLLARLTAPPSAIAFEPPILMLTAIHFHYAGFAGCVLVGLAGRRLGSGRTHATLALGSIAGMPMVAAGISLPQPLLELAGVTVLAMSLGGFSCWLLRRRRQITGRRARLLLTASSLCLLPAMAMALAFAAGQCLEAPLVALSWMARLHGPLNALGFCLAGLLGWTVAAQPSPVDAVDTGRRR